MMPDGPIEVLDLALEPGWFRRPGAPAGATAVDGGEGKEGEGKEGGDGEAREGKSIDDGLVMSGSATSVCGTYYKDGGADSKKVRSLLHHSVTLRCSKLIRQEFVVRACSADPPPNPHPNPHSRRSVFFSVAPASQLPSNRVPV
jgi:hypothetical protein